MPIACSTVMRILAVLVVFLKVRRFLCHSNIFPQLSNWRVKIAFGKQQIPVVSFTVCGIFSCRVLSQYGVLRYLTIMIKVRYRPSNKRLTVDLLKALIRRHNATFSNLGHSGIVLGANLNSSLINPETLYEKRKNKCPHSFFINLSSDHTAACTV